VTHLRRVPLLECQAHHHPAIRARSTERRTTGAEPPRHPFRSPVGATDRPTLQTVSTHSSLGTHREAVVITRGEVRPEAVASRSSVVMETTGVDSRVAAGGGHGAAGEHLNLDVHRPREATRLTTFFFSCAMLLRLSVPLFWCRRCKNVYCRIVKKKNLKM
jgi:hypothetical protein